MMYRKLTIVVVCVIAATIASPAAAILYVADNFDDSGTPLVGQTADTGQTWVAVSSGPLLVGLEYGKPAIGGQIGLTNGAGTASNTYTDNSLPFTAAVTNGMLIIDVDLQIQEVGFNDSSGANVAYALRDFPNGTGWGAAWFSNGNVLVDGWGTDAGRISFATATAMNVNGSMHQTMTINLDTGVAELDWFDNSDPSINGHIHMGTTSIGTYEPNHIYVSATGESDTINAGFDNLRVASDPLIPEPASLVLFGLGGMLLTVCDRRRRKEFVRTDR